MQNPNRAGVLLGRQGVALYTNALNADINNGLITVVIVGSECFTYRAAVYETDISTRNRLPTFRSTVSLAITPEAR